MTALPPLPGSFHVTVGCGCPDSRPYSSSRANLEHASTSPVAALAPELAKAKCRPCTPSCAQAVMLGSNHHPSRGLVRHASKHSLQCSANRCGELGEATSFPTALGPVIVFALAPLFCIALPCRTFIDVDRELQAHLAKGYGQPEKRSVFYQTSGLPSSASCWQAPWRYKEKRPSCSTLSNMDLPSGLRV